jgi:RND family efflux transporter MFP subunit
MDASQGQYNAALAMLKSAQEQLEQTNVKAEISGVIDEMNVKPGEFFSPQSAAQPGMGIRIVNNSRLKMVTGVPENYIARVKKGDSVQVVVPETGKAPYRTIISTVGASINSTNRSFTTEAKLPSDPLLKPNQTASMKILDYRVKNAVVVPVNVVQTDEKGKYVFVMERSGSKTIAKKKPVTVGEVYEGQIEIKGGLAHGEVIITEGYQSVYDGQAITTGI